MLSQDGLLFTPKWQQEAHLKYSQLHPITFTSQRPTWIHGKHVQKKRHFKLKGCNLTDGVGLCWDGVHTCDYRPLTSSYCWLAGLFLSFPCEACVDHLCYSLSFAACHPLGLVRLASTIFSSLGLPIFQSFHIIYSPSCHHHSTSSTRACISCLLYHTLQATFLSLLPSRLLL